MKFKVGDKVRCIDAKDYEDDSFLIRGNVYLVRHLGSGETLRLEGSEVNFLKCRFELVTEAKSELEELVEKANAGLTAYRELCAEYIHEVERFSPRTGNALLEPKMNPHWTLFHVRIKPKPKFEPYMIKSTGWIVHLNSKRLHIGCKSFDVNDFRRMLEYMLKDGPGGIEDSNGSFVPARNGIHYEGQPPLPWADAEELYNKIKDL